MKNDNLLLLTIFTIGALNIGLCTSGLLDSQLWSSNWFIFFINIVIDAFLLAFTYKVAKKRNIL
jgi:hypothetical protein